MKTLVLAAILLGSVAVHAADPAPPTVSNDEKKDLIIAYQDAVLKQAAVGQAQQAFQGAITDYQALLNKIIAEHKWPKDTTLNVDANTKSVTVKLPEPKKEEPAKK